MKLPESPRIAVIGLGYVGLPLAVEFGKKYATVGFDINQARIKKLENAQDDTGEVSEQNLRAAQQLVLTADTNALSGCDTFIVTVPTPIDKFNRPDLRPLQAASRTVGQHLGKGNVVIFESTVYPGATEEVCVPILEEVSGLRFNEDFAAGYSPERINPGDKTHRLTSILKVTSGSTPAAATYIDNLYKSIISAGTFLASSIRVAEAAKVIENTQRDVNIALVNELAHLFHRLNLDTEEVLEAAGTKWNFLPFRPGLVGGHCIGVDPYYLTHKAQEVGHVPEIILAGRRINNQMGEYAANRLLKLLASRRIHIAGSRILVLGLTFKENCPDIRNTKVIDLVRELQTFDATVEIYDPWVNAEDARSAYGVELIPTLVDGSYDAIVLAVAHEDFRQLGVERIRALGKSTSVIFDLKYILPADKVDGRL